MDDFVKRFFDSFDKLIDIVKSFNLFTKFAAFALLVAALLVIFFSRVGILNQVQTTYTLIGLLVIFVLVIVLSFIEHLTLRGEYISVLVYGEDEENKKRSLDGAEVILLSEHMPPPETTNYVGRAQFRLYKEDSGKDFKIRARKIGYLDDEIKVEWAKRKRPEEISLKKDLQAIQQDAREINEQRILEVLALYDPIGLRIEELKEKVKLSKADFNEACNDLIQLGYVDYALSIRKITKEGKKFLEKQRQHHA